MISDNIETHLTDWDKKFCTLALFVSTWSKDPRAKVGAVLVARAGGDISIGYNGFPMGVSDNDERLQDNDIKLELIVHAELNAIIASGARAYGGTLYVWGKPVCAKCAGTIIQAGIKKVVAFSPYDGDPNSKWVKSGKYANEMFQEAKIECIFYKPDDIKGRWQYTMNQINGDNL